MTPRTRRRPAPDCDPATAWIRQIPSTSVTGEASRIDIGAAPIESTVNEAPVQLECRVSHILRVPPVRTVFIADVVATTVHDGICDESWRLHPESAAFFGMMAGCGEFYTMNRKVGHIGQSVGRNDIRY